MFKLAQQSQATISSQAHQTIKQIGRKTTQLLIIKLTRMREDITLKILTTKL